jgi:hypothetical protein
VIVSVTRKVEYTKSSPTRISLFDEAFSMLSGVRKKSPLTCFTFSRSSEESLPSDEDMSDFLRLQIKTQFDISSVDSVQPVVGENFNGSFCVRYTSGADKEECFVVIQQVKNAIPNVGVATEPHRLDKYVVSPMAQTYRVSEDGYAFWQSGAYITTNLRGEFVLSKDTSAPLYKATRGTLSVSLSDLGGPYKLNDTMSTWIRSDRTVSVSTGDFTSLNGGADPFIHRDGAYISNYTFILGKTITPVRAVNFAAVIDARDPSSETVLSLISRRLELIQSYMSMISYGDYLEINAYSNAMKDAYSCVAVLQNFVGMMGIADTSTPMLRNNIRDILYFVSLGDYGMAAAVLRSFCTFVKNLVISSLGTFDVNEGIGDVDAFIESFPKLKDEHKALLSDASLIIQDIKDDKILPLLQEIIRSRSSKVLQDAYVGSGYLLPHIGKSTEILGSLAGHIRKEIAYIINLYPFLQGDLSKIMTYTETLGKFLLKVDNFADETYNFTEIARALVNLYGADAVRGSLDNARRSFDFMENFVSDCPADVDAILQLKEFFEKSLVSAVNGVDEEYAEQEMLYLVSVREHMNMIDLNTLYALIERTFTTAQTDLSNAGSRLAISPTFNEFYSFLSSSSSSIKTYMTEVKDSRDDTDLAPVIAVTTNYVSELDAIVSSLTHINSLYTELYGSIELASNSSNYSFVEEKLDEARTTLLAIVGVPVNLSSILTSLGEGYNQIQSQLDELHDAEAGIYNIRDLDCISSIRDITYYIYNNRDIAFSSFSNNAADKIKTVEIYLQTLPRDESEAEESEEEDEETEEEDEETEEEDEEAEEEDEELGNLDDLGSNTCNIAAPYESFVRYHPLNGRVVDVVSDVDAAFYSVEGGMLFIRNTGRRSRKMEFTCKVQSSPGLLPYINKNVIRHYAHTDDIVVYYDAECVVFLARFDEGEKLVTLKENSEVLKIAGSRILVSYRVFKRDDNGTPIRTCLVLGNAPIIVFNLTGGVTTVTFQMIVVFGDMVRSGISRVVVSDEAFEYFTCHYGKLISHQVQKDGVKIVSADQDVFDCTYLSQEDLMALQIAGYLITEDDLSVTATRVVGETLPVKRGSFIVYGRKLVRYVASVMTAPTDLVEGKYESAEGKTIDVLGRRGMVDVALLPFTVGLNTYYGDVVQGPVDAGVEEVTPEEFNGSLWSGGHVSSVGTLVEWDAVADVNGVFNIRVPALASGRIRVVRGSEVKDFVIKPSV